MSTQKNHNRISYKRRQQLWNLVESRYVVHAVLVLAVISVLVPIGWMFITSLKTPNGVFEPHYLPSDPTLNAYYETLIEASYWKAVLNSIIISTVSTIIVLALSVPAGYAFSRYRFPFDNVLFIGIIFSRLFPPVGIIVPYFQGIAALGLLNTIPGVIIAQVYLWLPLMIYIMRNFFISIPEALDESALVDGCTPFQAFRWIALPLSKPGIASVGVLTFLYSWREFLFSFITTSTLHARPISVAVFSFVGEVNVSWEQLAAASVVAIIPTIFVVLFFQKYIVGGLTTGALKGE